MQGKLHLKSKGFFYLCRLVKKGFRIAVWILAAILVLLLGLVVAVQSPKVQTALARRAVSMLSDKIDGDIQVGQISVRPFDAVTLEDVVVLDRSPYSDGTFVPRDTLVRVGNLSARFSLKGLLHKERISVSRLKLEDGMFNLVIEPGGPGEKSKTNLERVLRLAPSDPDKPKKDFGDLLEASKVDIEGFTFRMVNYDGAAKHEAKGLPPIPGNVIDWNDLEIKAEIHATDLLVKDGVISGDADHIRITDKTGLDLQDVSGKVKVGHGQVLLDNLHIQDKDSDLHLRYFRLIGTLDEDYKDFLDRVRIEGEFVAPTVFSMQTVSHFAPNMDRMTFQADLTGKVEGTVGDFAVKGFTFKEHGSDVQARVDGTMTGLPDIQSTRMDWKVKDLRFGLGGLGTFIQEWAPDVKMDLSKLGRGTDFNLNATAQGTLNRLAVKGDLASNAGTADVDIVLRDVIDKKRDISIGGTVRTRDLDAGRIAGVEALGPVTMTTTVDASLGKNMQVRIDSLNVKRLNALGYDYTGITAVGSYSNQAFDGRIVCDDPNLNALIQGKFDLSPRTRNAAYQFYANIGYADLNALNIDKRGPSVVSLQADANFIRTRDRDLLGDINLRDVVLENAAGRHHIGDITASAHANDEIHRVRFDSDFAQGSYVGDKSVVAMVSDLKDLVVRKELPSLLEKPGPAWDGTPYEVNFKFFDTRELLGFILPGLYIEKNTALQLKVDEEGILNGNVTSGRLALGGRYLKDFRLDFDNRNNAIRADVTGSAINLGGIELKDNNLSLMVDDDRFDLAYTFDNQTEDTGKADLRLSGELARSAGSLAVTASVLPSSVYYHGDRWILDSDDVTLHSGDLQIDRFRIRNGRQSLVVEGGLSPDKTDSLFVRMDHFDISLLNSFLMQGKMELKGQATGQASLISPSKPSMGLLAGITCDSTYLAGRPMGTLDVTSLWNDPEKRFDFRLRNRQDNYVRNFDIDGYLRPKDKAIRADAVLNQLDLAYAAPFLAGVFDRFSGGLNGKLSVDGTLDKLQISSEGMEIVNGLLGVEFTQVPYRVSGPVSVDTRGLHFQGVSIADGSDGKGTVTGSLLFGGFKDLRMDTHIQFDRMKVLGITDRNAPIFGDVYGTGRVDITGPFDALALNIDARTVKDGNLHIPLGSGSTQATGDLLVFTTPYEEIEDDPYEQMIKTSRTGKKKTQSDLDVRVRVRATPAVTAHIDIGENSLRGLGNGLIDLRVRTGQNLFTINGDYTLSQGDFKFSALNVVTREFSIRDGSSIRFNGDVMDSDLNVTGIYSTKASITTLLSGNRGNEAARRQVDCLIDITGKLRNPQIKFDIDIPELDPGTEGMVESALNTEDKVMKQFLYLLIANSFLPNEESGIITTGGSNMLYSNMTGIMAGQLNSIFQKLNIPLDLGLNYQQNAAGQNLFDVALSTQLFNNRVIVNGNIGNRRLYGTTTDEVAGDVDIDIKLDKPGTFRLNLFSHSADQYTSFLDNSQRNGIGFAYQREFNSLGQFFRDLFTPRKEREDRAAREALQGVERSILQIDSAGHAHPLTAPVSVIEDE
jgi:hypothetical protein